MLAIGYVRVSTIGQVEDGVSLETQKSRIHSWCTANDHQLVSLYIDAGISGKRTDNRPALCSALDEACSRKAAVVVYSLSRLARSTRDAISMSERLARSGADLVSLSEHIDTTSAAGKMVFRMLAVLAEFERDQIAERTSVAMRHKANLREYTGGHTPFGYILGKDRVHLVENQVEQNIIHLAKRMRSDGFSLRKIAFELNRQGFFGRTGRVFQPAQIKSMVDRRM